MSVATCVIEWGLIYSYATLGDISRDFSLYSDDEVWDDETWQGLRLYQHKVIPRITREEMMVVIRNVSVTERPAIEEQSLAPGNNKNKHSNYCGGIHQCPTN